jgi:predicted amidohydrolase YtcJ
MSPRLLLLLACLIHVACAGDRPSPSDAPVTLAVINGRVWTGDPARPWAEALAAAGENLVAVGTSEEIRARSGDATPIDARGRLIVPGFIDTHTHFVDGGFRLSSVQLRDANTRQEFIRRIREFAATVPAGTWITGGDWDHSLWGGELPTRAWLDEATTSHPVWISRLDGHMSVANSTALKAAGVTRATKDVAGGEIVRDASGEPTGLLKEDNAKALVDRAMPPPSEQMLDRALEAAMKYVAERGVTSVHDLGAWEHQATVARAHQRRALTTCIYSVVPLADWEKLREVVARRQHGGVDGRGDEWMRVGALKGYVDGSLGSHTAAFHKPFDDTPRDRGLLINTPEDLYRWISGADKAGLHVMVHAIGDRANDLLLDLFERVAKENGSRDRRFRIEHAQHLSTAAIPRFGALGVIASMQPYHAIDDGRWAEQFIGERIRTTYAFRGLLDTKAPLAFGSDWYVAPPTPLEGIYAAVTRRTLDDRNPGGWVPEQKITVEEALRAYTSGAAYASFEEQRKGTLARGRLADFVILERNLFEIAPEQIRDVKVDLTVVGGRKVYERRRQGRL